MRKEYASLKRRPFFMPVWLLVLAFAVGLAGAAWALRVASTTVVVVMRHAEKADETSADPPLSAAGVERAGRLAAIFGSRQAFAFDAIFVTQWRRTAATAEPLAKRLGAPVIEVQADDTAGLEARILDEFRGKRVLVVAHSDSVPALVHELSRGAAVPSIAAGEYGTTYVIAIPRWSRPTVLALALP